MTSVSSATNNGIDSPPGKEQIHPNATKKEKQGKLASFPSKAVANSSAQLAPNSTVQALQSSVTDLKRQLDQARAQKEQAETKVCCPNFHDMCYL